MRNPDHLQRNKNIILVGNIGWYLYNFRKDLMRRLSQEGFTVYFCCGKDEYVEKLIAEGFVYLPMEFERKGMNLFKDLLQLFSLVLIYRQIRPQVTLHFTIKPNIYGGWAAFLTGIPFINSVTGLGYVFLNNTIPCRIIQLLLKSTCSIASRVFFQNKDDIDLLFQRMSLPAEKIVLVKGAGVDVAYFSPEHKGLPAVEKGNFNFLYSGRLLFDKGFKEYIYAAKTIKELYPQVTFGVLGFIDFGNPAGVDAEFIQNWVDQGVIQYYGHTSDVRPYLASADCVVLPSYREGTPKALLEASAMGKPIITTDAVGCKEVIDDGINGFQAKMKDVDSLRAAMLKMIQVPIDVRMAMGKAGRNKVLNEFQDTQVIDLYYNEIQKLIFIANDDNILRKPVKILYFVMEDWYFWSHRLPLAREAKRKGYEVLVATRVDQHGERMRQEGFRVIPLNMQRRSMNPLKEWQAILEVIKIYRQEKPDLVHQVAMKPVLYGSLAAFVTGVPCVINALMGLGYIFSSDQLKARWLRPVIINYFRIFLNSRRSRLILQNKDDQALFIQTRILKPEKIRLIRGSGVDTSSFKLASPSNGMPLVILVSRMLWDKGIGEFVEAARLLTADGVQARFVLVGDADEHNPNTVPNQQLQEWAKNGVIEWWGKKDNIDKVLSEANIACLPSFYGEGIPKTLLEAASCGLPIVTTDAPGCREIVRHNDNGLLIPIRNVPELAKALQRLIEDPDLRRKMGARSREIAVNEFSVEKVVAETMAVYEELLTQ